MATKQVNIDIIAKDKTRQAMNSATKGVDGLKNSVFNLKNALIGIGAGVAIKSFIDVGKQVESLQIRLKFLFGSVEEGAKAFDVMSQFASKVPFSLEQIQQGAGNLAVVSKDAKELSKMLEITGRVASVTGLDFRTTAEQIQRSFSAGIASADIFRERGVRDLLGFKAGATVTAKETAEAFERVFGKDGRFAGATKDLAGTLQGTLSMIGDKYFSFQKTVAEAFFVGLKSEFGALDKALEDNADVIQKVAKAVGEGLSNAVIMAGKGVRFLHDNFKTIKALGMGLVVFKITQSFLGMALAIGRVRLAMVAMSRFSKTTLIGILAGIGIAVAEATNNLDKMFKMFEKPKSIEDFKEEIPGKKTLEVKTPKVNEPDDTEVTMTDLEKALGLDDAKREYAADALAAASKAFFEGRGFEAISDAAQVKSKAPEIKRLAALEEFKMKGAKEIAKTKARNKTYAPGNAQKNYEFFIGQGVPEEEALNLSMKLARNFDAAFLDLQKDGTVTAKKFDSLARARNIDPLPSVDTEELEVGKVYYVPNEKKLVSVVLKAGKKDIVETKY